MDSGPEYISDKYLESEEVAEYEAGRPLSFFENLKNNEKKLRYELAMLNHISMTDEHEEALIPHEKGTTSHLNRYCDILPYKSTAVILDTAGHDGENSYINANYIPGCLGEKDSFIACQGPKSNTVKDFWRMVRQENIGAILMLCKVYEDGRPKCEEYWPEKDQSLVFDEIDLKVQWDDEKTEGEALYHRDFSLIDTQNDEVISKIKQIHYTGWPDHGVPKKQGLDDFQTLVENSYSQYKTASENNSKVLIHCSAGIGRTGTLLSILNIVADIEKKKEQEEEISNISVFSVVRKLREHRFHLVQSESQYIFIYQFLAKYLKNL